MLWDYRLARQAFKNLRKFPKKEQRRIFAILEEMKGNPFLGDIKLMQGEENLYRRRKGNYRIYFRPIQLQHIIDISLIERKSS
ncbi:MAG: type II toxin-antitoxin system RelE/ParE family toxin [Patescibacteria group bacterium]